MEFVHASNLTREQIINIRKKHPKIWLVVEANYLPASARKIVESEFIEIPFRNAMYFYDRTRQQSRLNLKKKLVEEIIAAKPGRFYVLDEYGKWLSAHGFYAKSELKFYKAAKLYPYSPYSY